MTEQTFLNLLGTILTAAVSGLIAFMSSYFKSAKNVKVNEAIVHAANAAETQIKAKKGLAYDAMMFAKDAWANADGNEKLAAAVEWAVKEANNRGLNVTTDGIEGLIRSEYQTLKANLQTAIPADTAPAAVVSEATTPVAQAVETTLATDTASATPTEQATSTTAAPTAADTITAAVTAANNAVSALQAAITAAGAITTATPTA